MLEKYEVCCGLFHGFDYATAMDHALALNDGKKRQ